MTEIRNISSNSGIIAGGNVSNSRIIHNGPENTASDDNLVEELSALIAELVKNARQLPDAGDRDAVRTEAIQLQGEIESPDRDRGRVASSLGRLKSAVAVAAPLAEIVKDIADMTGQLIH